MKLHPEDPRLTAYVLGELSPEEAAAVEKAAAADPAIEAEISEIRAMQRLLHNRLTIGPEQLLPNQRENVRRHARDASGSGSLRERLQPWLIPMCGAAVLAIATTILFLMPQPPEKPKAADSGSSNPAAPAKPEVASNHPAPGPANPAAQTAANVPPNTDLPALVRRPAVKAIEVPTMELPVQAGKSSLPWVSKSIMTDGKLPFSDAVRPEELLNSFQYRFSGTTAIARVRDQAENADGTISAPVATLSTEMIACPWKPSSTLLLISLKGNPDKDCDVRLSYHSNPGNVFRYRLIGFASMAGAKAPGHLPTRLAANSATVLAIEIEPSKPGSELGSLVWSADGKPAPEVNLMHKSDAEPSNDARFAALVCTFSQWLAGEQSGAIDADIVSGLAREIASSDMPAERSEFLSLIDRSLHL